MLISILVQNYVSRRFLLCTTCTLLLMIFCRPGSAKIIWVVSCTSDINAITGMTYDDDHTSKFFRNGSRSLTCPKCLQSNVLREPS